MSEEENSLLKNQIKKDIPPDEQELKLLLVVKYKNKNDQVGSYLSRRGWPTRVVSSLGEMIKELTTDVPHFILLSVNHPNPKLLALPNMLIQMFNTKIIIIGEDQTSQTIRKINSAKCKFKWTNSISGPSVHRSIIKLILDEQKAEQDNVDKGITPSDKEVSDSITVKGSSEDKMKELMKFMTDKGDDSTKTSGGVESDAGDEMVKSSGPGSAANQIKSSIQGSVNNSKGFEAAGADSTLKEKSGIMIQKNDKMNQENKSQLTNTSTEKSKHVNPSENTSTSKTSHVNPDENSSTAKTSHINPGENSKNANASQMNADSNNNKTNNNDFGESSNKPSSNMNVQESASTVQQNKSSNASANDSSSLKATEKGAKTSAKQNKSAASESKIDPMGSPIVSQADKLEQNKPRLEDAKTSKTSSMINNAAEASAGNSKNASSLQNKQKKLSEDSSAADEESKSKKSAAEQVKKADVNEAFDAFKEADEKKKREENNENKIAKVKDLKTLYKAINTAVKNAADDKFTDGKRMGFVDQTMMISVRSEQLKGYLTITYPEGIYDDSFSMDFRSSLIQELSFMRSSLSIDTAIDIDIVQVDILTFADEASKFSIKCFHNNHEITVAFFEYENMPPSTLPMFKGKSIIDVDSLVTRVPVKFKAYIHLKKNDKFYLYLKGGRNLLKRQQKRLLESNVTQLYIDNSDEESYKIYLAENYINNMIESYFKNFLKNSA